VRHFAKPNETKMKTNLQLILVSILLLTFGCKEKSNGQKTTGIEKQVERKTSIEQQIDSTLEKKKKLVPKHYEHKFVIARSGLNYRDSPNGKVLGKFPLNTSLKLIEHTKIADKINDGGKIIEGEWVGVQNWVGSVKDSEIVYVFDGFLSNSYVQSDIKLYNVSSFYKSNEGTTRTAFLNLSETYFENTYSENEDRNKNLILNETDLKKDTIRLNKNQRKKLMDKLKVSESDKVFIYIMKTDNILSFNVKDLPAIACMNIYGPSSDYRNDEFDYMFGFDLDKSIINWDDNLVFIGKENPFQTGKLKPIVWTKIKNNQFPIINELNKNAKSLTTYRFAINKYDYFLQKATERALCHHIIIIDNTSKEIVFDRLYCDGEGTSRTGLNIVGNENSEFHQSQWTGKLFKNKASIVFGFSYYGFGCPSINVLDETEPAIPILCDNRH